MANIDRNLQASSPFTLVGGDEANAVDVVLESGKRKALVSIPDNHEKYFPLIDNSNWMILGAYDQVVPVYTGSNNSILTLSYNYFGYNIGKAVITLNSATSWSMALERFLVDDDGGYLLNDDNLPLNLD